MNSIVAFLTRFLLLNCPAIVYFATRKKVSSNFNLVMDMHARNVTTAKLPPEVVRKYDDIDEKEIIKKEYGDLVIKFIDVLRKEISNENFTLLINNVSTLTFEKKDYSKSKKVASVYYILDNKISLDKKRYMKTIWHELFHISSSFYDKTKKIIYSGFAQHISVNEFIGEGINEGYTQYLTEKYFGDKEDILISYCYLTKIAECTEMIVGSKKMESLYFSANLNGLIKELEKYSSLDDIHKFIKELDLIHKHLENYPYLSRKNKENLVNIISDINVYIIQTYLNKFVLESGEEINVYNLSNALTSIITILPAKFKVGNKSFEIYNDESLANAVSSVLSGNFEFSEDKKSLIRK